MTPAIHEAKKLGLKYEIHQYDHDPNGESYGLEAAHKLGVAEQRVFKTLVVSYDKNNLAVAVVPVSSMLNMKTMAKALNTKRVSMADAGDVERSTGYVLGGVSPLGQKRKLNTVIDSSAADFETVFVSAGRRGLEIELDPNDLISITKGNFFYIRQ